MLISPVSYRHGPTDSHGPREFVVPRVHTPLDPQEGPFVKIRISSCQAPLVHQGHVALLPSPPGPNTCSSRPCRHMAVPGLPVLSEPDRLEMPIPEPVRCGPALPTLTRWPRNPNGDRVPLQSRGDQFVRRPGSSRPTPIPM